MLKLFNMTQELIYTDFEALFMCALSFVSGVIIGAIIVIGIFKND